MSQREKARAPRSRWRRSLGFVPDTLAEDGDPLDALVLLDDPTFPGCWVTCRPVAVLWMEDDKGEDAKVICVPAGDIRWETVNDLANIPRELTAEIQHFFEVYKDLEPGKSVEGANWVGRADAESEVRASRRRYEAGVADGTYHDPGVAPAARPVGQPPVE